MYKDPNDFQKAVSLLLELNKQHRLKYREQLKWMSKESYNREYCTVHINIGRQVGKSQYIINNITKNDVLITFSDRMVRYYKEQTNKNIDIYSYVIHNILSYRNIYIDEPKFIENKMDDIYEMFSNPYIEQTFILLGE